MRPAPGRSVPGAYRAATAMMRPFLMAFTERHWSGAENLPQEGGFIAISNHVSNLDPLTFAHFLIDNNVPVKMMAKASLFKIPLGGGKIIASAGMIPVERGSSKAGNSLVAAKAALAKGEAVGMFPEGTLTNDPDGWPMRARTGVARLALETGVPVIPIAQWGAHRLVPPHSQRPTKLARQRLDVVAGPPIDLSEFAGANPTGQVLRAATDKMMGVLRTMVGEIRGETPPEHVWDLSTDGTYREAMARRAAGTE